MVPKNVPIVPKNALRAFLAFTAHLFTPQNHKEVGTDTVLILHIRKLKQESVFLFFSFAGSSLLWRFFSSCGEQGLLSLRRWALGARVSVAVTPRL